MYGFVIFFVFWVKGYQTGVGIYDVLADDFGLISTV